MGFDFEKEFLRDYERITKTLHHIIARAKEKNKDQNPEITVAHEVLRYSFSSYIRIFEKYEIYQLEKFKVIQDKLDK